MALDFSTTDNTFITGQSVWLINVFSCTCSASFSPKCPQFNEDLNHTVGNESQHVTLCKTLLEQIMLEWQNVIYVSKAEQGRSASICWTGIVFEICASYCASGLTSSYRQTPSTCISSKAGWKCYRLDSGVCICCNIFFSTVFSVMCLFDIRRNTNWKIRS